MGFWLESEREADVGAWLEALGALRVCAGTLYHDFCLYQQGLKENPAQARSPQLVDALVALTKARKRLPVNAEYDEYVHNMERYSDPKLSDRVSDAGGKVKSAAEALADCCRRDEKRLKVVRRDLASKRSVQWCVEAKSPDDRGHAKTLLDDGDDRADGAYFGSLARGIPSCR